MSVGRICQRRVDVAKPDESVQSAAKRMLQRSVGTLVVTDDTDEPIGILTDRDVVLRVVATGKDARQVKVRDVMTREPTWIAEDRPIEEALATMRLNASRRLPIVDGNSKLVGIVSLDDVLKLLADEFAAIGDVVRQELPGARTSV